MKPTLHPLVALALSPMVPPESTVYVAELITASDLVPGDEIASSIHGDDLGCVNRVRPDTRGVFVDFEEPGHSAYFFATDVLTVRRKVAPF